MSKSNDPLAALISKDAKDIDRQKLAELLQPFVIIDEGSHEFGFHDAFSAKENVEKIEIILAAVKARSLYFEEQDGLFPSDIINLGVIPKGSVKSTLKKLYDKKKILQDKDGHYFLPTYRVLELAKKLSTK
jgi:hypothetical protein